MPDGHGIDRLRSRAVRPCSQKVIVNIDAAEIAKVKTQIDVPACCDVGVFIRAMLDRCETPAKNCTEWLDRCRQWKKRYPVVTSDHWAQKRSVSTYCLSDAISDAMRDDDLVVTGSSGNGVEIFLLAFRANAASAVFHARGLGAMGFAQPAAIGACVGSGGRRTISVDGDGGFQMNIQELQTLARLQLPIKFFVVNNQGYGSIRASQKNWFGRLHGADATSGLTLPNLMRVSEAYGIPAIQIAENDELREKVRTVLAMPGPVICEVLATPDEVRPAAFLQAACERVDGLDAVGRFVALPGSR